MNKESVPDIIITADSNYLSLAIQELQKSDPPIGDFQEAAPGILLATTSTGFFTLAEQWRQQPPIFIRHICPVQLILPFAHPAAEMGALQTAVKDQLAPFFDPTLPFSVQTRCLGSQALKPFQLNEALAPIIEAESGAPLDVKSPVQVLSIVTDSSHVYLGISLVQQNLSNWAGGERRFAREKGQISRAEFKLLEAIEQFGLALPARGHALDLGAAPGGWTRVLRQKGQLVTAVDPGQLHPSLIHDTAIRHLPIAAEKYLTQYPDSYDLIVNDMRLDARDSARLMVAYTPYLYAHGEAIMTLKLPINDPLKPLDHAINILKQAYNVAQIRQLFHNRHEVTVYLKSNNPR